MPTLSLQPLTQKQEQILLIIELSQIVGKPTPTYQELAYLTGRSSRGSMVSHVKGLYEKGYLRQNHQPGDRGRGFGVIAPIVAPRYIGVLDLFDGSLSLGEPKRIPHSKRWEGCVGLELLRDDPDRCRKAGDILILRPVSGYQGQSMEKLEWWGNAPEQMVFDQEPKASFDLVGLWRDLG